MWKKKKGPGGARRGIIPWTKLPNKMEWLWYVQVTTLCGFDLIRIIKTQSWSDLRIEPTKKLTRIKPNLTHNDQKSSLTKQSKHLVTQATHVVKFGELRYIYYNFFNTMLQSLDKLPTLIIKVITSCCHVPANWSSKGFNCQLSIAKKNKLNIWITDCPAQKVLI